MCFGERRKIGVFKSINSIQNDVVVRRSDLICVHKMSLLHFEHTTCSIFRSTFFPFHIRNALIFHSANLFWIRFATKFTHRKLIVLYHTMNFDLIRQIKILSNMFFFFKLTTPNFSIALNDIG